MRIAVTGAAGFIGSWLAADLNAAGHHVVGADIVRGPWVHDHFSLTSPYRALEWLGHHRPDAVVHLAAQVGRVLGEDDVALTVQSNAEATAVLASAAAVHGVRMVYASSSEVYGDRGTESYDEDTPWLIPKNLYGLSKGWGEQVCRLYCPDNLVIARLSMPYGPGVPPGRGRRAMDTFLWAAHHRQPITVYRGAERSWCWVGDTVRGIRLALERPEGGVYNVGRDDDPRTMREIAELACKLAGASTDIIREVDPDGFETPVKRLSTERLRSLGWAPTVELEDGMARVYDWVSGYDEDGNR
jgi:nucleoside-diphosphate-sugar epimerase